jgi:prepilin-type N-terminal cleavage/methylation domain-containing protein
MKKRFSKIFHPLADRAKLNCGFTLVELLIAIGLLLFLFLIAIPNYRSYQRSRSLERAYQQIVADLRMAQEYAMSGKKPQDTGNPCLTNNLEKYFVEWDSKYIYTVGVKCSTSYKLKVVDLTETGIIMSNFGSIGFKVLGEGTDISIGSPRIITLTQANTGATRRVIINASGEIH